jgi:hypothetical protein
MGGIGSIEFRKVNEAGIGVESDGRIGAAWIERR